MSIGTSERRSTPRFPLDAQVRIQSPAGALSGAALDVSVGGVRVQLPRPLPPGEVQVSLTLPQARQSQLLITSADLVPRGAEGRLAVARFHRWLPELERYLDARGAPGVVPLTVTTAVQALRSTPDHRSLGALLARGAAAHAEQARVFSNDPNGWRPLVEADATGLRWGGSDGPGALPQSGSLTLTPICRKDVPVLLLATVGTSGEGQGALEELCREAAAACERLCPPELPDQEWWSLEEQRRQAILDGLLDRSREVREASMLELGALGLDLAGYHPDLPRRNALALRREIEELANARRWWAEHLG